MQDYPEAARRQGMLRAVHEWIQEHDYNDHLIFSEVIKMGERFGMSDAQSLNVFETLIDEGYINARLTKGYKGGPRFNSAIPKSLTDKGLIAIGEVPNPTEQLIRGFQAAIQSIEQDPTMPPEEKRRKIDGLNQTVGFLLNLGAAYTKQILDGIISPGS